MEVVTKSYDQVQLENFYQTLTTEKKAVLSLYPYDPEQQQYHVVTESLPVTSPWSSIMSAMFRGLHRSRYNNANLLGQIDGDSLVLTVATQEKPSLIDVDEEEEYDDHDYDNDEDDFEEEEDYDEDDDIEDNCRLMTIYLPNELGIALKVFLREPTNSELLGILMGKLVNHYTKKTYGKTHE
jgi:hypothetical protein